MIPAGYLYKTVWPPPGFLNDATRAKLTDICSVSSCVNSDFADYVNFWRHNGYWLFDSPEPMRTIAAEEGIELSETTLFYYEVFENELLDDFRTWRSIKPETSFVTNVTPPASKRLLGYDVVTFTGGPAPECSPLSCNAMADELPVNEHCLFESFEAARQNLESGVFHDCEPGPYRIFAVYVVTDRA